LVTALGGDVRYSANGGGFVPVPVGARLKKGDVIKTGPASHADLQFGHNVGIMQLTPNTTFAITELSVTQTPADGNVTDNQFDLNSGAIYTKVNKLSKASRFEVKTPKGIAGVRGTSLFLSSNGDLAVGEGTAGIAYPNGGGVDTFIVRSGEMVSPGDKAPHQAPGQLLKDIIDALQDAGNHGIGRELQPFVPPVDIFVSPTIPNKRPKNNGNGGGEGGGESLKR
jgi:hypothetical protein